MRSWKLALLALAPGVWGWLSNWLLARFLYGPDVLFSLAFYLQAPVGAAFCLWLGRRCGLAGRGFPSSLLLTQWPSPVSLALYVWQFHFISSAARSTLLAGLGQYPALPLLSLATPLVWPFAGNDWGPPETLAAIVISLVLLAALFSLGYLWGRRRARRETAALAAYGRAEGAPKDGVRPS